MAITCQWILDMIHEEVRTDVDLVIMKDYIAATNDEYNMDIDVAAVDALSMDDIVKIQVDS